MSFGSLLLDKKIGESDLYTLSNGKTTIESFINIKIRADNRKSCLNDGCEFIVLDTNEFGVTTLINESENVSIQVNNEKTEKYTILHDGDHIEFVIMRLKYSNPSLDEKHLEQTKQTLIKKLMPSKLPIPLKRLQSANSTQRRFSTGYITSEVESPPIISTQTLILSSQNSPSVMEDEVFDFQNPLPIAEDITAACPLPISSWRESWLKKPSFTQRRSVKFSYPSYADDSTTESSSLTLEEESLEDAKRNKNDQEFDVDVHVQNSSSLEWEKSVIVNSSEMSLFETPPSTLGSKSSSSFIESDYDSDLRVSIYYNTLSGMEDVHVNREKPRVSEDVFETPKAKSPNESVCDLTDTRSSQKLFGKSLDKNLRKYIRSSNSIKETLANLAGQESENYLGESSKSTGRKSPISARKRKRPIEKAGIKDRVSGVITRSRKKKQEVGEAKPTSPRKSRNKANIEYKPAAKGRSKKKKQEKKNGCRCVTEVGKKGTGNKGKGTVKSKKGGKPKAEDNNVEETVKNKTSRNNKKTRKDEEVSVTIKQGEDNENTDDKNTEEEAGKLLDQPD